MRQPICIFCSRTALELEGQFAILQGYLLDPQSPVEIPCGTCHLQCLFASPWGGAWAERRIRHVERVLRHELVGDRDGYRLYRDPRNHEWLVVAASGDFFGMRFGAERGARKVSGGRLVAVEHNDYNLELPDHPDLVAEAQAELTKTKRYPLPKLIEGIGLTDRMVHPEALADGALVFDRALRRDWSPTWLSVRLRYALFVPEEVFAMIDASGLMNRPVNR